MGSGRSHRSAGIEGVECHQGPASRGAGEQQWQQQFGRLDNGEAATGAGTIRAGS